MQAPEVELGIIPGSSVCSHLPRPLTASDCGQRGPGWRDQASSCLRNRILVASRVVPESQAPCRAVCRPCGFFQMMHGGVSAPSCCAFMEEGMASHSSMLAWRTHGLRRLDSLEAAQGTYSSTSGLSPLKNSRGKWGFIPLQLILLFTFCRERNHKVPGRRRGTRGFPAAPRQRPRESFFNAGK